MCALMQRREGTKQVAIWLDVETHAALKALAAERQTKISVLAEHFIRDGLGLVAAERLEGPALPAVRQLVEEITTRHTERQAGLIVKAFIEAAMARRLMYGRDLLVRAQRAAEVE